MDDKVVYLGMDLGSFKTSVCCSNGRRDVVQSVVGWPKDHIARGWLGREVVFGEEVETHRMALRAVRPFEMGVLKYNDHAQAGISGELLALHRKAANLLVRYAVIVNPLLGFFMKLKYFAGMVAEECFQSR